HTSHGTTALTTVVKNQDENVSSYGDGGGVRDCAMERMAKQLRQLHDKVEGRPERRARGHPFSREILVAPLLNNFRETNLVYDGSSDPSRHVRTFENMVALHGYYDSVCCRAFLSTLRMRALDWFHKLSPESIADFGDFASKLTNQYSSVLAHEKTYLTLMAMKQGENESLKKYVARYNQTCLEVHSASDEKTMRDDRWQGRSLLFERQRYHNFTPLRKDMTEVLEAMEQKMPREDVTWPKTRFTGPTRPRSDIYCRFHRDYGHTTENCRRLKDEIERLIRAGHLKEFVYHDRVKGKGRRRCREDSKERSDRDEEGGDRDGREKRFRRDGEKGGQGGETLTKRGTIYMILGGPTNGDSNNARKGHARAMKKKREEVGITGHMPVISFKAEDAEGVVLPHNDALVITAEVAGFDVKRVFIDTESSADVMFYVCFVQINKELSMELKPVATTLYGFNRGEVMPMGEISLLVALGSGVTRKVRMVRFVVVDAESSYNIIMGRTILNAFQAVVSMYHMTIKYPVGENVGEIAGDQPTSRRFYQTTVSNNKQLARRKAKPKEEEVAQLGGSRSNEDRLRIEKGKEKV
ncbi:Unknown protein, partial [Striga hermonthica]